MLSTSRTDRNCLLVMVTFSQQVEWLQGANLAAKPVSTLDALDALYKSCIRAWMQALLEGFEGLAWSGAQIYAHINICPEPEQAWWVWQAPGWPKSYWPWNWHAHTHRSHRVYAGSAVTFTKQENHGSVAEIYCVGRFWYECVEGQLLSKSWQALRKLRLPAAWAPHTQSRCSKTRGLGLCKVADVHVEKTWRNNTQEIVLQCDWSLHDLHLHLHVQRDWPHGKTDLRNYRLITNLFGWHTFDEMLVNHGKSVSALQSFTFQDWHF